MKQRIVGFDVARALAIFGMVIVNFKVAMSANTGSPFLLNFAQLFEGRASALFVIIAGIGITFMSNKARLSNDNLSISKSRKSLIKRGLLLVFIGLLYTPIWEADILHFYGFYFMIAAVVIAIKDRALLVIATMIVLAFPLLMLLFNYEQNWNWATLSYENFWSLDGMIRHIVFNGFHPIFPWAAFLIFGMWLGRQDLSQPSLRLTLLFRSLLVLIAIEGLFYFARLTLGDGSAHGMNSEEVSFLFSTSIIPPLPQYMISASSSAVIVLIGCLYVSDQFSDSRIIKWLSQTGKLSLTLYLAHVILGLGSIESMGLLENQTINFSLFSASVFCLSGVAFSVIWLKFFKMGPLEWLFRQVAN
jgi:uncharacterized membrane protein YeiB